MNKLRFKYPLAILILVFSLSACDHETDTFDGPNLVDRFAEFILLENLVVSQPTVDFSAGEEVFFTARFNKRINWVIEITGMESGAVKRIGDFGNEITAAESTWTGGTTDLPFFKAEECTVKLLVPEEPDFSDSVQVEILSTKSYANSGVLITDFEVAQPGVIERNFDSKFSGNTGRSNDIIAAQGEFYLFIEGTNNGVGDPFFIGLFEILASVTNETYIPVPTSNPEELFFNYFVYNDGRPYGIAIVDFATDSNDNGVYDGGDALINPFGETPLTWEGWRQISFPMSTLGNITQEQLEKLVAVRLILINDHNAQPVPPEPVGFGADFMIFTEGGPLEL